MTVFMMRIGVLILVSILLLLIVWSGRRFVEAQRRRALATVPLTLSGGDTDAHASLSLVRILAFSSADCRQCHEMQIPALQRVLDAGGRAHAVNYGFANTQRLLDQVDEVLAQVSVS